MRSTLDRGGADNQAWLDELANLGPAPAIDDIVRLREQITKQVGIDIYRLDGEAGCEALAIQRPARPIGFFTFWTDELRPRLRSLR